MVFLIKKVIVIKNEIMLINNNKLPNRIIEMINSGNWKEPVKRTNLFQLILDNSPFDDDFNLLRGMIKDFKLYNLELMKLESQGFIKWRNFGGKIMFHGKDDELVNPGKINPEKLILFADFGIGNDTPFGLDYQKNELSPNVVLLYYGKDPYTENRWVELTSTFEEFESIVWKK